ncbi:hypothetical protein ABPG77_003714 [Micractinium sp. CCAP 211/92]
MQLRCRVQTDTAEESGALAGYSTLRQLGISQGLSIGQPCALRGSALPSVPPSLTQLDLSLPAGGTLDALRWPANLQRLTITAPSSNSAPGAGVAGGHFAAPTIRLQPCSCAGCWPAGFWTSLGSLHVEAPRVTVRLDACRALHSCRSMRIVAASDSQAQRGADDEGARAAESASLEEFRPWLAALAPIFAATMLRRVEIFAGSASLDAEWDGSPPEPDVPDCNGSGLFFAIFDLLTGPTSPSPATAAPVGVSPAATTTPSPATTTSPLPQTTTSPSPANTASPSPASTGGFDLLPPANTGAPPAAVPGPTPAAAAPTGSVPSPPAATGTPPAAGAPPSGNVTTGTPPVNMPPGSDTTPGSTVGTVGATVPSPPTDNLPPAPPEAWQALQKDIQIVFDIEIRGPFIVPFTNPKAVVIGRVLQNRYFRSAALADITVAALRTFTYLSYDSPTNADPVPTGSGRRLSSRDLLQTDKSGAELKIVLATNSVRVPSEISSLEDGVTSGSLADDITLAGIIVDNITMLTAPFTEDLIGPGTQEGNTENSDLPGWAIGVIVGAILLIVPGPLFLLVRWRKRKNKEAAAIAEAEAEAARQRMQSRVMRPGSKSFSLKPGGSAADIMVMSGSAGGLAGYAHNGRLQSWSGSPERMYGQQYQGQYAISRATSVTSMGSALPSARASSYVQPGRVPSLPGHPRAPLPASMVPPPGAYEEELQTARTARSTQG